MLLPIMTARQSTKITVDLKDEELYKALKYASVDSRVQIREIVVAALERYLLPERFVVTPMKVEGSVTGRLTTGPNLQDLPR